MFQNGQPNGSHYLLIRVSSDAEAEVVKALQSRTVGRKLMGMATPKSVSIIVTMTIHLI